MSLYTMPSGLGGSFIVRITKELEDDRVQVVIDMNNPDFDGHSIVTRKSELTPYIRNS